MLLELPRARPFLTSVIRPILVDARVEGPETFGLPPSSISADGGGWWEWTFEQMMGWTPDHIRTLRAFASRLQRSTRVVIPVVDDPQLISPHPDLVPHSDDTPFSDETLYAGNSVSAELVGAFALRADELVIEINTGQDLRGGEYFSLGRGELGPELHLIDEVVSLGSDRWAVSVSPKLRMAHASGAVCEFDRPKFTATCPDTSGMWPAIGVDWIARATATFVEAVR